MIIWFYLSPRNFNPRNFRFLVGFSCKTIFAPSPTTTTLVSKDVEFSGASFDICEKFAAWCPLTQTPTQKFKIKFSIFSSHEIGSSLVLLEIIFEALQSELVRFNFHLLRSKLQKIPEFNSWLAGRSYISLGNILILSFFARHKWFTQKRGFVF